LNRRQIVAGLALALILFLAYLTVRVMIADGVDFLVLVSLGVLAVLGFGVLGALGSSADE
jgi:hypothetical protein